jgi:GNAT superfamily N-acetyltransferase
VSTCLSTYSLARETIHLFGTKPSAREQGYGQLLLTLLETKTAHLAVELGDDQSAQKWWANRGFQTKTTSGALPRLFPVRKPFFCCLFALPSYGYRKRSSQVGHLRPCTRALRALYSANCGHHK